MIDKEAVTGALDALSDAINAQINALDGNDRGTEDDDEEALH